LGVIVDDVKYGLNWRRRGRREVGRPERRCSDQFRVSGQAPVV